MIKALNLPLFLTHFSSRTGVRHFLKTHFFTIVAVVTFSLIVTAQMFWSTIHGDGAVYAWITKEMAFGSFFSTKLPSWDQTQVFAEHPYLFFYFGGLFVKLFGVSDIALKLPNFCIAAFSVAILYKTSQAHFQDSKKARQLGLIAGYALLLNSTYIMQISQPSLDPMAQCLGLLSAVVLIFGGPLFLSGIILGLAFLTKGLELLPNLAALILVTGFLKKSSLRDLVKSIGLVLAGSVTPVLLWLTMDHLMWGGQWLNTYWTRQFTHRFLQSQNMKKVLDLGYLTTALQVYFFEFIVLGVWLLTTDAFKRKKSDPLFLYFAIYSIFNILAFLIIKKDSSQHLTGIILFGALFVAEALWDIWQKLGARRIKVVPLSLLCMTFGYWLWFVANADLNPDIWTVVKNESRIKAPAIPVVVHNPTAESYGLFHTAQWYSKSDQVFFDSDADLLLGKEVLFFSEKNGQLLSARVIYKKGIF